MRKSFVRKERIKYPKITHKFETDCEFSFSLCSSIPRGFLVAMI